MDRLIPGQGAFVRENGRLRKRRRGSLVRRMWATKLSPDFLNVTQQEIMSALLAPQVPKVKVSICNEAGLSTLRSELLDESTREWDWTEILAQRAREVAAFRESGLSMPAYAAPATNASLFVRPFRWLRK